MANLFSEFLKPFSSGLAAPKGGALPTSSPFDLGGAKAPNQSTPTGARYVAPAAPATKQSAPAPAAPAATVAAPVGTPVTLPTGANVYMNPQGGISGAPSSFSIDVSKPMPSSALESMTTSTDVQGLYSQYVKQLADAYKPSTDYLAALAAVQGVKAKDAELDLKLLTGDVAGDTLDFAQGRTARAKGFNALEGLRAEQALNVQELIRQGNIEAAKALVGASQPQSLSYGQTLTNPITGETIAVGQTQPSYSATASPFGGYLVFDQRSGQYSVVGADALTGGGAGFGGGASGGLPTFLQPAMGEIAGVQYIDVGKIAPNQLPYAQQVAAQQGIPLLSKEDANEIQKAQAVYSGAMSLLNVIGDSALALITAESIPEAGAQAVKLNARALLPSSPEKVFADSRKAFLSLLTRAAGEVGVLTDLDVARIEKALPSFLDTKESAQIKLDQLDSIFNAQVQGKVQAYLGSVQPATVPGAGQIDMSVYAF